MTDKTEDTKKNEIVNTIVTATATKRLRKELAEAKTGTAKPMSELLGGANPNANANGQ